MNMSTPAPATPPPAMTIAVWPAEVLCQQLVSEDADRRVLALGMAVLPEAPVDACVESLVKASALSLGDPLACQLAATAFGCLSPGRATPDVLSCLIQLLASDQGMPVRIAATHSLFRLKCLPEAAMPSVCQLLLSTDPDARKVALLAVTPFAADRASAIAASVAQTPPEGWTSEALLALGRSASGKTSSIQSIEAFLMRGLAGAHLLPTGIAAYAGMAQMNPQGAGLPALVRVASDVAHGAAATAALEALGALGELAKPVARDVAALLLSTEDAAREELLCRTLVALRSQHGDLPVKRVLQRVIEGPARSAAAHCMLLCLHPKEFAPAAPAVRQRFSTATAALQQVLSQTHKTLVGVALIDNPALQGA